MCDACYTEQEYPQDGGCRKKADSLYLRVAHRFSLYEEARIFVIFIQAMEGNSKFFPWLNLCDQL